MWQSDALPARYSSNHLPIPISIRELSGKGLHQAAGKFLSVLFFIPTSESLVILPVISHLLVAYARTFSYFMSCSHVITALDNRP